MANDDFGVTWVTLDAPLVQVGGITAHAAQFADQSRRLAQEDRADPEALLLGDEQPLGHQLPRLPGRPGRVPLRAAPASRPADDAEASRFATGFSQPLVAVPGRGAAPDAAPLLRVEPADVLVTALKPSDDGGR